MEIPTKKLKNGFEMPVYGFGIWGVGGRFERDESNDAAEVQALKGALEEGVTLIDTAELYGDTHGEELVRQAIQDTPREKIFLISKLHRDHVLHDDILEAVKGSLARLGTGYLDLYLVHFPNLEHLEEVIETMNEIVDLGLARHIGVCNFSKETLAQAIQLSKHPIVLNQVHYNLVYREPELTGLVEFCREHDIFLQAWRPVQKGILADNHSQVMKGVCEKYAKTPAQIAINWLISQDGVITISKTSHKEHLMENLGAIGWEMESEDIERLRKEFPGQQAVSDAVPLG